MVEASARPRRSLFMHEQRAAWLGLTGASFAAVNPLLDDKTIEFLLYDVLDAEGLLALPAFAEHSRETFDMVVGNARKLARTALFPVYREMDQTPRFESGHITLHPKMRDLYPKLLELGLAPATRGEDVGGQSLPLMIDSAAQPYLCAANLGVA